eukprot:comp18192_c0_seq1/m.32084 comp18192_c0_seq1/g.32084  ORF comp18192_c0_seq1/g.32084 comp18192_c0_seq1/m.32084 type:complete len:123 (-) comp18192_c0_seq1:18-386(-)
MAWLPCALPVLFAAAADSGLGSGPWVSADRIHGCDEAVAVVSVAFAFAFAFAVAAAVEVEVSSWGCEAGFGADANLRLSCRDSKNDGCARCICISERDIMLAPTRTSPDRVATPNITYFVMT